MTKNANQELVTVETFQHITGLSRKLAWWSPTKAFERDEVNQTAERFDADSEMVKGKKTLFDVKHPKWKALGTVRNEINEWWYRVTRPYEVDGVRLINRDKKGELLEQVEKFNVVLREKANELDSVRRELIEGARNKLGKLFRDWYYPESFAGQFELQVRERSIEPSRTLAHSNSEEYKRELALCLEDVRRSQRQFEGQCWARMSELAEKLASMLAGEGNLCQSKLDSFQELFDHVSYHSFEGTEVFRVALENAASIVDGVDAKELRAKDGLRKEKTEELERFMKEFKELKVRVEG